MDSVRNSCDVLYNCENIHVKKRKMLFLKLIFSVVVNFHLIACSVSKHETGGQDDIIILQVFHSLVLFKMDLFVVFMFALISSPWGGAAKKDKWRT